MDRKFPLEVFALRGLFFFNYYSRYQQMLAISQFSWGQVNIFALSKLIAVQVELVDIKHLSHMLLPQKILPLCQSDK